MVSYVKITSTKLWRNTGSSPSVPHDRLSVYLQATICAGLSVRTRIEIVRRPSTRQGRQHLEWCLVHPRSFQLDYSARDRRYLQSVLYFQTCFVRFRYLLSDVCCKCRRYDPVEQTTQQSDVKQNWSVSATRGRRETFTCFTWETFRRKMLQVNVCSLGWVIESNTLRSVTSVSLSEPD